MEDDIQCETTKLKQQFMNPEEHGLSFAHIAGDLLDDDCEEGDEECENEFSKYVSSKVKNFEIFHRRI